MGEVARLESLEDRARMRAARGSWPGRAFWLWRARTLRQERLTRLLRIHSPRRSRVVVPLPVREVRGDE